jgi:hypothetical protein
MGFSRKFEWSSGQQSTASPSPLQLLSLQLLAVAVIIQCSLFSTASLPRSAHLSISLFIHHFITCWWPQLFLLESPASLSFFPPSIIHRQTFFFFYLFSSPLLLPWLFLFRCPSALGCRT